MFKLRVRTANDNGSIGANSYILDTKMVSFSETLNGEAALSFSVSRDDFDPASYPFVVQVEYTVDGTKTYQPLPENSLFIIEKDSDDSLDVGKIVAYEAVSFVPWLLSGALVHWSTNSKDGSRTWVEPGRSDASAGYTLTGMITESKAGGWFPALTTNFNGVTDSNNVAWVTADKAKISWEMTKHLSDVLEQLVSEGLCDWVSSGTTLKLYRPGTMGTNKTGMVVGGTGFTRVPVKVDASELISHIRAVPEGLPWQNFSSDATIRSRFGHRSAVLTQSGVKDVATSVKQAQAHIEAGRELLREEAYEWTPTQDKVNPFRDFVLGDTLTALSRGGRKARRVIGIIVDQGEDYATAQVRVGESIKSGTAKVLKKLGSTAVGGIVGGSGSSFPANQPANLAPIAPSGLIVTNNIGVWLPDGSAQSVVGLSWSAVTELIDGSEVDIVEYQLWSRLPSEERSLDLTVTGTYTTAEVDFYSPGTARLLSVRALSSLGKWSDFSLEVLVTPVYPSSIVPKPPTGLAHTSNNGTWTSSGPMATIVLDWADVTQSTDGEPIDVVEYEVWSNSAPLLRVPTSTATLTLPSGLAATHRVRARTEHGGWGDLSSTLSVTAATPPVAVRAPSAPVLSTSLGNVAVKWDGVYVPNTTSGAGVVVAEQLISGTWVAQGAAMPRAGTVTVPSTNGAVVHVRLRAYDSVGRLTGTSAEAQITAVGVNLGDLSSSVQTMLSDMDSEITEAQSTADGKNKVWYSNTKPPGTNHKIDDVWFDGANGNRISLWNGTDFVVRQMGTNAIANLAITNALIANLDAAKITTGFLAASRIEARSMTVDKLAIGDFENLAVNGDFKDGKTSWGGTSTVVTSSTEPNYMQVVTAATGNNDQPNHYVFAVKGGEEFYVSYEVFADESNATYNSANVHLAAYKYPSGTEWPSVSIGSAALQAAAGTWVPVTGTITIPLTAHSARVEPAVGGNGTAGNTYRFRNVMVRRKATGELIVDGAITADKVLMNQGFADKFWANEGNFGKIAVDMLMPNVGETLNLWANEAVEIMVGRQDSQDHAVAEAQQSADTADGRAQSAEQGVAQAKAAAAIADGKALVADTKAQATQDQLAAHQAVFRVTSAGAEVASKDGANVFAMTPAGAQIIQGGTVASYWDGTQFVSNEILTNRAVLANHIVEKSGAGTVFRAK